jgi:hypothetical protein
MFYRSGFYCYFGTTVYQYAGNNPRNYVDIFNYEVFHHWYGKIISVFEDTVRKMFGHFRSKYVKASLFTG